MRHSLLSENSVACLTEVTAVDLYEFLSCSLSVRCFNTLKYQTKAVLKDSVYSYMCFCSLKADIIKSLFKSSSTEYASFIYHGMMVCPEAREQPMHVTSRLMLLIMSMKKLTF